MQERYDPAEVARRAQNYYIEDFDPAAQKQERLGWLYNYSVAEVFEEATKQTHQALTLLFFGADGKTWKANFKYKPYFLIVPQEDAVEEIELGLKSTFAGIFAEIVRIEKEDLDMPGHLSGKKRLFLKLCFWNVQDLKTVREKLAPAVKRNQKTSKNFTFAIRGGEDMNTDAPFYKRSSVAFLDKITDIREYDVHYHVRVAIDNDIFVGKWYLVGGEGGQVTVRGDTEDRINPVPRVLAFDIETTKAPLKFPQPEMDQIYMISWMLDGRGFLIINREIVSQDIDDFEYTPKPEYEGIFRVWNVANEEALLRKWFECVREQRPHVYVTYNGDYFDFPFMDIRAKLYGMDMNEHLGFRDVNGETVSPYCPHLDCLYWVNRDSYLPQGSRGLKAVAKYKLGYEPLEVHHEDMLPMAQKDPQKMAAYSVSDAVATYYLFMKYVHPFIYSLCTIIPMKPDEVLRKGSGTCCEHLLMVKAHDNNVCFPNKEMASRERFHQGHLLDQDTYVGGHVEALKSGIFRADVPIQFDTDPAKFQELIDKVDGALEFAITVENKMKVEDVTNYKEVRDDIVGKLEALRDKPKRMEVPHILHLDVSAMYPNIILTNRLQPPAMVSPEDCAACPYNREDSNCKRRMKWIWRGETFVLNRGELNRLKQQLQTERFEQKKVDETKTKMAGKKDWKFAKRKPLVDKKGGKGGKAFGGKGKGKWKGGYHGGGTGYRKHGDNAAVRQRMLEEEMHQSGSDQEDQGDGKMGFGDLKEDEQFSMLKKRVTEYCRKAYKKLHATVTETRTATVCQRENGFFINTVLQFRDRRYVYKGELKKWKGKLEQALEGKEGVPDVLTCKSKVVLYESLQLAHKCILNSFYGYVMRKGSRWYSMEMAACVTYCGATLIMMARELVDRIGVSLELDTDGIWCCLPGSFPMDYTFQTTKGKKVKISYPCVMLNKDTADLYTNHQYQVQTGPNEYATKSECSILFEVDGPYLSMVLPASQDEGKGIKKRYAVFEFDGSLAELKGFELKRRGELQIIKDFQATIFGRGSPWLAGKSLSEAYHEVAKIANHCLDILYSKGVEVDDEELMAKIQESGSMSRRLDEYAADQKGMALTCARRLACFLGEDMVKDKGLTCTYIISRKPEGKPVTERPIPIQIFATEAKVRVHWLRKWCEDPMIGRADDVDIRDIVDWDYYIKRLGSCIQKIVTIPAAYQSIANPVPRVAHPEWLGKRVREELSGLRQEKLSGLLVPRKPKPQPKLPRSPPSADIEDIGALKAASAPAAPAAPDAPAVQSRKRVRDTAPSAAFMGKYCGPEVDKGMSVGAQCASWVTSFVRDPGFGRWLGAARETWAEIARGGTGKARRVAGGQSGPGGALRQMLQSAQDQLLQQEWDLLELRQDPTDPPQVVRAICLVGDSVKQLRLVVPRVVLVNSRTEWDAATQAQFGAKEVQYTLPRQRQRMRLYQVPLTAHSRDAERDVQLQLRCSPQTEGVYETAVPAGLRAILRLGSRCKVDVGAHQRRQRAGASANTFHVDDLVPIEGADGATQAKYLAKQPSIVFIFQCGNQQRGLVCAVMAHSSSARAAYWRGPLAGPDSGPAWGELFSEATAESARTQTPGMSEAAEAVLGAPPQELVVQATFSADEAGAWRSIEVGLKQDLAVARRVVIVTQTQHSPEGVLARLPSAAGFPVVPVPFHSDDQLLASESLQWPRELARRALYRFLSARPFLAELIAMARFSGIPVANIADDMHINVLDVLYSKKLTRHGFALWCSSGPSPDTGHDGYDDDDVVSAARLQEKEEPVRVTKPGSYNTWVVELEMRHLSVMSILFSQNLMEAEEASALAFDSSVLPHYQLLRELTMSLYTRLVKDGCEEPEWLLTDLPRWLRSRSSLLHEPQLALFAHDITRRLFGALVTHIQQLGCHIVYAEWTKIIVATPKSNFADAMNFTNYLLTAIREQAVCDMRPFEHIELEVQRWWSDYVFLSKDDYAGMAVPGLPMSETGGLAMAGIVPEEYAKQARIEVHWEIAKRFPPPTQQRFALFTMEFLATLHKERSNAVAAVEADGDAGTLASREERIRQRTISGMRERIEGAFTTRLLKEAHNIRHEQMQQREEKFKAREHHEQSREVDIPVEYTKCICHVLGQEGALVDSVRHLKQAVLRILKVDPHSEQAQWRPRPQGVQVPAVICAYCRGIFPLELLPGGLPEVEALAADPPAAAALWRCACGQRHDTDLVESKLVDMANAKVASLQTHDLECARCRLPQEHDLQRSCHCGGDWISSGGSAGAADVRDYLLRLAGAARVHRLPWLLEVANSLLSL